MTAGPVPANPAANATLKWDAENRLVQATVGSTTTSYEYDYLSRLVKSTTGSAVFHYLYDGWNRIAEYSGTTSPTHLRSNLWGLDLSGSLQRAGGVGGLLSIVETAGTVRYYPSYDGNGNVSEYVNQLGAEVAHFEYDPFGNLTVDDQGNAASFPYRFSTKPQDPTTGLYYYGYRYYDPKTGRWPSRDPIGEKGGFNLYGMVGNGPLSRIDYLGREVIHINDDVVYVTGIGSMVKGDCGKTIKPSKETGWKWDEEDQRWHKEAENFWNDHTNDREKEVGGEVVDSKEFGEIPWYRTGWGMCRRYLLSVGDLFCQ